MTVTSGVVTVAVVPGGAVTVAVVIGVGTVTVADTVGTAGVGSETAGGETVGSRSLEGVCEGRAAAAVDDAAAVLATLAALAPGLLSAVSK